MIADDAEILADLRRDMQRGLQRPDHRNVDRRPATINAEIQHAERHDRVIALPLGLTESLMKQRCRGLNLGRTETVKGTRRDPDNPDLNLG